MISAISVGLISGTVFRSVITPILLKYGKDIRAIFEVVNRHPGARRDFLSPVLECPELDRLDLLDRKTPDNPLGQRKFTVIGARLNLPEHLPGAGAWPIGGQATVIYY